MGWLNWDALGLDTGTVHPCLDFALTYLPYLGSYLPT